MLLGPFTHGAASPSPNWAPDLVSWGIKLYTYTPPFFFYYYYSLVKF